ncbi:MAG: fatty acid desaturase family protein [Pseudomonadota bacterium]
MKLSDYLSPDEVRSFREGSDLLGVWQIAVNYALIAAGFAIFILWPNPLTFLLGAMIQAGRILGLVVLNHDATHSALFKTRSWNRPFGRWLLAGPSLGDFDSYRDGHLKHHKFAGTDNDPDIPFVQGYPTTGQSMRRKFTRDLTGQIGLRDLKYLIQNSTLSKRVPFLVTHGVMIALLALAGNVWAYSMWWVGFIFLYPAFMRIRVMGEHGAVAELIHSDPRRNTRTTIANPIERLFICPNYVNFHCEHHTLANVPGRKLPKLHKLLKERGFYNEHSYAVENGYFDVVKRCIGSVEDRPAVTVRQGAASYADMS